MIKAHAEALFITSSMSDRKLKEAVQDTLRDCGLFFIYDEAHFLVGEAKSRNSHPLRLNWLRQRVVDRNLGVAFFVTRQAYSQALNQFVTRTHYAMEQWAGRLERPLMLPLKWERGDVMSVARRNFPDIDPDLLEEMAAEAMASNYPAHELETLARRAIYFAGQSSRPRPSKDDVKRAIELWSSRPAQESFETKGGPEAPDTLPKHTPSRSGPVFPALPPQRPSGSAAARRQARGTTPAEAAPSADSAPRFSTEQLSATAGG